MITCRALATRLASRQLLGSKHVGSVLITPTARGFSFSPTFQCMEKIVVKLPTLGDAITEGTIVEWVVEVGQPVKEGDVVALVETDKVTVDIKAEADGVLTAQHVAIDDNVEVGSNLYEIDTEAASTVVEQAEKVDLSEETIVPSSTESSMEQGETSGVRIPSIKFLGKEGWMKRRSVVGVDSANNSKPEKPMRPQDAITLDGVGIDAMYGRKTFSEREIEALLLGGASEAPWVKSGSTGAVFLH